MSKLEILYFTDIHDNLKKLRFAIQNTSADLYIISGDLIYKAFYNEEKLYNFVALQDFFYNYIKKNELNMNPQEAAVFILKNSEKYSEDLLLDAAEYNILFKKATANMKEKYHTIFDLMNKYANAPSYFLPGNYDMNLQHTSLYEYDLHKNKFICNKISFGGYGGAPIITPGIPEKLSVVFDEYFNNKKLYSEPLNFFKETAPDILTIHNPAYGTLDTLSGYGHCGSYGIREYIDDFNPSLVLSGHVHEDYGFLKVGNTFCINPSNFGGVDSKYGYSAGGYFCRLLIEKTSQVHLNKLILYRLIEEQINPVLEIVIENKEKPVENILNKKEFDILGRFLR
ncbi:MAG: metallophosphoesterase [Spirochaetia bacterium]|nr:metallophosphoesterase [Spirochaetia bacterium]